MIFAILPLNAAEGTRPALGRQFMTYPAERLRRIGAEGIHAINYLIQVDSEDGPRTGMVNFTDLNSPEMLKNMFSSTGAERAIDGTLQRNEDGTFEMTLRILASGAEEPLSSESWTFGAEDVFERLRHIENVIVEQSAFVIPAGMELVFPTENADALLAYFEGFDAIYYIQQSGGRVAQEFEIIGAMESLRKALELDPKMVAAAEAMATLGRLAAAHKIGSYDDVRAALDSAAPFAEDAAAFWFAYGEVAETAQDVTRAAEAYEKSLRLHEQTFGEDPLAEEFDPMRRQERAAIYSRLGACQMEQGMPVNAERNLRRAVDLENDPKPTLDLLADVLHSTGRGHEVVAQFRERAERMPTDANAQTKLAMALMANERPEEAEKVLENALSTVDDPSQVKVVYAPILKQRGDLDRAMDFFEDAIDSDPANVGLKLQYADTLREAGREFEIPNVLKGVLASEPEANTKAIAQAWLIELEQPKRVQAVDQAREKLEAGDAEGALADLRPLRNWLADYWKFWVTMAAAQNRSGKPVEAEESARILINIFPACEPAYGELVNALDTQGKHEDAYNALRYAAQQIPSSLSVFLNLAMAAKRIGRDDEARHLAGQIRAAVGDNAELAPVLAELEAV